MKRMIRRLKAEILKSTSILSWGGWLDTFGASFGFTSSGFFFVTSASLAAPSVGTTLLGELGLA